MATITTLASAFSGTVGPVRFTDGVGTSDNPGALAFFRGRPSEFSVTEDEPTEDEPTPEPVSLVKAEDADPEPDPIAAAWAELEARNIDGLRDFAKEHGINLQGARTKDPILAIIRTWHDALED
jgi:hypothetical protein